MDNNKPLDVYTASRNYAGVMNAIALDPTNNTLPNINCVLANPTEVNNIAGQTMNMNGDKNPNLTHWYNTINNGGNLNISNSAGSGSTYIQSMTNRAGGVTTFGLVVLL